MANHYIFDGWNVIWKIDDISALIPNDLELARKKFQLFIEDYFHNQKVKYKIVYDGQPGIPNNLPKSSRKKIIFSKKPDSADSLILRFLKKQKSPKIWTLVSSDRQLTFLAKDYGVKILSSEQFVKSVKTRRAKSERALQNQEPNLSQNEIDYWLNIFNSEKK